MGLGSGVGWFREGLGSRGCERFFFFFVFNGFFIGSRGSFVFLIGYGLYKVCLLYGFVYYYSGFIGFFRIGL